MSDDMSKIVFDRNIYYSLNFFADIRVLWAHSLLLFSATMYIVPFNTNSFVCLCIEIVLNVLSVWYRDKQLQTTPAGTQDWDETS